MSLNRILATSMIAATLTAAAVLRPSPTQALRAASCPPGYVPSGPYQMGLPGQPATLLCKRLPIQTPKPTPTHTPRGTPTNTPPTATPRPSPHPTIPICPRGVIAPIYDAQHRVVVRYVCPPLRLLQKVK